VVLPDVIAALRSLVGLLVGAIPIVLRPDCSDAASKSLIPRLRSSSPGSAGLALATTSTLGWAGWTSSRRYLVDPGHVPGRSEHSHSVEALNDGWDAPAGLPPRWARRVGTATRVGLPYSAHK
jgi:hypothetical protein